MKRSRKHDPEWIAARDAALAAQPYCSVCGSTHGIVPHHYGRRQGIARKDHSKLAVLCFTHHTGSEGVHPLGRKTFRARFGDVFGEDEQ